MSADDTLADRLGLIGPSAQWNAVAPGWARQRAYIWDVSRDLVARIVQALDPQPGETILELAAGPGDTGFAAAAHLAANGRLISTDVAPKMVATAEKRGRELGLTNVDYRVVDAQAIDLPDESVDGTVCRWGFMLVPEPDLALAETFRVLRPGGRVVFTVWAEAAANPWGTAIGRALLERGLIERPDPDAPGPFRLGDIARVQALVHGAGFEAPEIEDVPVTWHHDSLDGFWAVTADLSFLLTTALEALDADVIDGVRARVGEELQPYADANGRLAIPGLCRNVLARKK
jgi:SAM-dependent methyltransferase